MTHAEDLVPILLLTHTADRTALLHEALVSVDSPVIAPPPSEILGVQAMAIMLSRTGISLVVYDVTPVYAESWRIFELLQAREEARGMRFIRTTDSHARLVANVGRDAARDVIQAPP